MALLSKVTAIFLGKVNILNTHLGKIVFGLNTKWFQLLKKKKLTLVPALGTNFERSTELTGVLQSSGNGMRTGVPELKY